MSAVMPVCLGAVALHSIQLISSGMEQQHQTLFHLMEFPFLSAEVEAHTEPLFERVLKGGCGWWSAVNAERCNTHRCGMPTESAGRADVRFVQRLLQEDVDREVRAGHVHQHRDPALLLQLAERLRSVRFILARCPRLRITSRSASLWFMSGSHLAQLEVRSRLLKRLTLCFAISAVSRSWRP